MILSYSNWKILIESSDANLKLHAQGTLSEKPTASRMNRERSDKLIEAITSQITSLFPDATVESNIITIPQNKFEDIDGQTNALQINLPSWLGIIDDLNYPTIIWNWFNENSKENFSKAKNKVNCLLKEEFLNYSKDELINKIETDLLEKHGISSDGIIDEIEHIMLSQSLGEIGGNVETLVQELIEKMGSSFNIKNSIELLKSTNLNLDLIDVNKLDSQINERLNKIIIDYSKLSPEELKLVLEEIAKTLKFLNTLFVLGKDISKIALKQSDKLLDHLDEYPKVLEMLQSDYL